IVRSTSFGTFDFTVQNGVQSSGSYDSATDTSRIWLVSGGRDGGSAINLKTYPLDYNHGSETWPADRNDLSAGGSSDYCNEGQEEWWAVSILFPSDYVFPNGAGNGGIFDFHHNQGGGQANFEIDTIVGHTGVQMRFSGGACCSQENDRVDVPDP